MKRSGNRHSEALNICEPRRKPVNEDSVTMDHTKNDRLNDTDAHAEACPQHDPVSGMAVTADSPHRLVHNRVNHHFCSAHCLDKFRSEPARYIVH